jgi:tRNA dimethylallyltransferase
MPPRVLVLVGPTASGKTAVSLEVARLLGAEIVSADSRQVYRFMDIGTAKPTSEQRIGIPHHFIDERDPDQEVNAGEFGTLGRERIAQILSRGRLPLVVGGSGLYVQSLIDGFFEGPGADPEYRAVLERRLESGGTGELMAELEKVDPESARRIDPTKPRRIVRALEVFHTTGAPMSELHRDARQEIPFEPVLVGLTMERSALYARINERCGRMVQQGLVEEAKGLESRGFPRSLNALNTVGYVEAFAFLSGKVTSERMLEVFRQNSRRYAKRQLTWFRRDGRIVWLDAGLSGPVGLAQRVSEVFLAWEPR